MDCCPDRESYEKVFSRRFSRSSARRYLRRGLAGPARRIADFLQAGGLTGVSVLEVGGGVGDLEVDLLRRGAASALNLEISESYDEDARALEERFGVTGRIVRRTVDLAREPQAVEPADVVVLNRVVCCYPDYEGLLSAAAGRARGRLAFSHPTANPLQRTAVWFENLRNRVLGREFRAYVHDPAAMVAVVEAAGLRRVMSHRGLTWSVVGFERSAT